MYELTPASDTVVEGFSLNLTELNQDRTNVRKSPRLSVIVPGKVSVGASIPLFSHIFLPNYLIYVVIILFAHLRS